MKLDLILILSSSLGFLYLGYLSLFKTNRYTNSARLQQRLEQILGERAQSISTPILLKPKESLGEGSLYKLSWAIATPTYWGRFLYRLMVQRRRKAQCETQLPETLDWIARALRAGHSLSVALSLASQDAAEPLGSELRMAVDALRYGRSMEDCLHQLSARLPGTDLRFVVIAILVQRETGGNLADLLSRVANTLRARMLLKSFVQAQSAEGKMSAWVLTLLPVLLLLWTAWVSPHAIHILMTDPLGQCLMASALFALLLGTFWVWHFTRIRQ
jgi:tight adherence protein B